MSSDLKNTPRALGLALSLCATAFFGCQTFEMEKVEPKAVAAEQVDIAVQGKMDKSLITLVIDKSGSMLNGVANPNGTCRDGSALGYDRAGDCRWNSLLDAFVGTADGSSEGFLRKSQQMNDGKGSALFGLATYPIGAACDAGNVDVQLSETDDNVKAIINALNAIAPSGGTPTAPTLNNLLLQDALLNTETKTRQRFVMLLTDGSPNCNPSLENKQRCDACNEDGTVEGCNDLYSLIPETTLMRCYPTNSASVAGQGVYCDYGQPAELYGTDCLDKDHTVEAIEALRAKGVDTFVIGFGNTGDDLSTRLTLNAAAIAGGHPVGENGDDIRFYEATNTDTLAAALEEILNAATGCSFQLDPMPTSCAEVQINLITTATAEVRTLVPNQEWTCEETRDDAGTLTNVAVTILDTETDKICTDRLMESATGTYELKFIYQVTM